MPPQATFVQKNDKFVVRTEDPDGQPGEFEVKFTFGVTPLQQYLVDMPGGRGDSSITNVGLPALRRLSYVNETRCDTGTWLRVLDRDHGEQQEHHSLACS